jgi:CspA family cold shock protein
MEKKMKGKVAQFGTKGYGFIAGDDGEKGVEKHPKSINESKATNSNFFIN